ncbi:hypothetical protein HMSSN139_33050 [Paenibacillus sp. HMSSN-139]|nr:hypothetical protein HMSSN139_33050 [Paenibacillus sp. HMSSN-139]
MPIPFANTPSFSGSHITGYDNMLKAILGYLYERSDERSIAAAGGKQLNVLLGFEPYTGNFAELKRLLELFGAEYTVLGDHSENFDSGADGSYAYYYGGTRLADVPTAAKAKGSLALQNTACAKRSPTWRKLGGKGYRRCTRR